MFVNLYHYRANIVDIPDGNSCTADIDLGFNICLRSVTLHLYRVSTPKEKNNSARIFLKKLLVGKNVTLESVEDRKGNYFAEVWVVDKSGKRINVNDFLVEKKLAHYK